eukprot:TRINITY_DN3156_c0_g1_i6.p1 TRINITY_DN3156_c0_g1~~TRINITY_DN3156_c0_g1_i6.p1  ORF type:complete len:700 (+),score=107.21 TRINITY_DN3156_c0_g1_i6:205-2304(+)
MDAAALPASSAWREASSFRALSQDESVCTYNTDGRVLTTASNETTSMVASDYSDLLGFAHTDPFNNRSNTSGLTFGRQVNERLSVLGQIKTDAGINDMCWTGNLLLAGSTSGSVLLYDTAQLIYDGPTSPNSDLQDFVSLQQTIPFHWLVNPQAGAPVAGEHLMSQRVTQVDMVASDASRFVAVDNNRLTRWNLGNTSEPEYDQLESDFPIQCCGLQPTSRELCILGTTPGALKMKDFRVPGGECAWQVSQAHRGAVYEVLWNPFSPFWVASSGEDALVQLWDLRSTKMPVLKMAGHHNAVTELSWSNSHAEILASGGWDRRVKIWNLNASGGQMMDDFQKPFSSMISGVEFCRRSHDSLVATSVSGEAACITLTDDFLEPMVVHKFEVEESNEQKQMVYALKSGHKVHHNENGVEKLFYFRQIKQAVMLAINLAKGHQLSDEKLGDAKTLIELCKALPAVECCDALDPALSIEDKAEMKIQFLKEMDQLSYRLPPGTDDIDSLDHSPDVMTEYQFLKESVDMLDDLAAARFGEFENHKQRILGWDAGDWIKSTKKMLVLRRTVAEYLEADGPAAFEFAGMMCDKFEDRHKFLEFGMVADLLVHPSIYEHHSSKVTKLGQDSVVEHCKVPHWRTSVSVENLLDKLLVYRTTRPSGYRFGFSSSSWRRPRERTTQMLQPTLLIWWRPIESSWLMGKRPPS